MTDLDTAVSALVDLVTTRTPRGDGLPDHVTVDPCLLDQLETAISSTIGGQGNGATGKDERNILNGDALYKFMLIASAVGSWCTTAGIRRRSNAKDSLIAFSEAKPDAGEFYIRTLQQWADMIRDTLRPRKRLEVTDPCPECEADTYPNTEGEQITHPVVVEYERDNPLETVTGTCRACGHEWGGLLAVRALRFDLGEKIPV